MARRHGHSKALSRQPSVRSLCPNHCAASVPNVLCHDHCYGTGDTTCHDHCYGAQDVGCHDHCYGANDIHCHDHCYGAGDSACQDDCFGSGGPKPPTPPGQCESHCTPSVNNSQCDNHCTGAGDVNCHNWCFGANDLTCHDHCYGANDTQCHDHCYGSGAVNCHDSCAPKPQPHIPQPLPSPGGGPSAGGHVTTGRPTIVRGTIPSDSITGAIAQPPGVIPGPGGGTSVGIPGQGSGARTSTGSGAAARNRLGTPLAPGTAAATGAGGQNAATARSGRTTARTGARPIRHPGTPSLIPVGVPAFTPAIEHIIGVIPWWVWLAIGMALSFATAAGVAAWRSSRRARARAGEVAIVKADAMTDPLTGILNRRGFTTVAQRELERAQRYGHPLALAFVDVRGLKSVNDTRGHQAGDELLKQVAALLTASSRSHDVVGRLGGDELAVMLTEQGADGMAAVMRRVRAQLPAARAELGFDHDWDLTIGIAVYPRDGHSVEALLAAADRRLYMQRGIELR
jgi:diguanylate cyclase (GGDEF)-like protein